VDNITSIVNFLNSFGKQVVTDSKSFLRESKGQTKLANTIRFQVKRRGSIYTIQFSMADYGTFVDKGVRGSGGVISSGVNEGSYRGKRFYRTYEGKRKQSPYSFGKTRNGQLTRALDKWIVKKGIAPRDRKGRFMTRKGLKIAMARTIYIRGLKGISFFQKSLEIGFRNDAFTKGILKAVKQDIIDNITVKTRIK
jgi:hypothetical protein|tara:strand:- start:821 stop:1405 length:585 start_codon:yes stop_codon:yes gene_type:complete